VDGSGEIVYEALGSYIDDLSGSIFIGTARGRVVMYKGRTYNLTPTEEPLPFLNVFYSHGTLEITGVWVEDGRSEAVLIKMTPSGMEVREGKEIYLTFRPKSGGIVMVVLYANEGFASTLRSVIKECKKEGSGKLLASRVRG